MLLSDLEIKLQQAEVALEREKGAVLALVAKGETAEAKAKEAEQLAEACEEASKLLAQYADERQEQVLQTIQNIASVGLSQVFGEPMELKITQVVRARRVEMDVTVKTGDLETSILDARGGGLAAVAGFLLRASVLLLTPGARRFMVLDEVFAHLSEEYLEGMGLFICDLCEKTGLQVLMVTHSPEFSDVAHKTYRIERVNPTTSRFVEEK